MMAIPFRLQCVNPEGREAYGASWLPPNIGHSEANTKWPLIRRRHFNCISFNEKVSIQMKISQKFVPLDPIDNISSLVKIMAWHQTGDNSEPMMA